MKTKWPIVPLCEAQLLDIRKEHILENGLYRKCDIYKGGGGYDEFNTIYKNIFGTTPSQFQFVVQLYGCPITCPYCYVTKEGVFGKPIYKTTYEIITSYIDSECDVFHLMGGAPALYLKYWKKFASRVKIFHSDFILFECEYNINWLTNLPGVYVVNFKDHMKYTQKEFKNLETIIESGINFYITFTGKPLLKNYLIKKYGRQLLKHSFVIPIKYGYKALKEVSK